MDAFLKLFDGLPQQGPGSDPSTLRALGMIENLPAGPRILDIGCGPGRQTLALAAALKDCRITAVDLHQPFLDQLGEAAAQAGVADRIETRCVSMDAIDEAPEAYDLIWSEGAVYLIGLEIGLRLWRPLLQAKGWIALTEATWLSASHPIPAMSFWAEAYPEMTDIKGNLKTLRRCGFEPLEPFILPAQDWWRNYYRPLQARIERLRAQAESDPDLAEALEVTTREIELFERHGDSYGYVFYVARKVA